jgi:hypothetical protein
MTDPQNCGGCGVVCGGGVGSCANGICAPVEVNLGMAGRQVATLADKVFVVRSDAAAELVAYSVNFTSADMPLFTMPSCDGNGFLSAGAQRVYYRPQNAGDVCNSMYEFVYSCDAALACNLTQYTIPDHINGAVAVGTDFYFIAPAGVMHRDTLSAAGIPAETNPPPKVVESMVQVGGGGFLLEYDAKRDALWWTTYEGCVYRVFRSQLPQSSIGCFGATVPSYGRLVISPNDEFYVGGVTNGGIWEIDPEAVVPTPGTQFAPEGIGLLAVDGDYVYAFEPATSSLVVLHHGTAQERVRLAVTDPVIGADAAHPQYLFFTAGTYLYRWRKPLPSSP